MTVTMTLMRALRLDLDSFARACGTDPEFIRRLVALGLLDADRDVSGELWFLPAQIAVVGRIRRLRAAFPLNYASLGLVCDLLDRIAVLESALRHRTGDRPWT
ncbi:chaperone modulator CbpM [Actinomadura sp. DC4]|uniref:chaperone modulator CbpM n=1 Tax=Actinomadura sp. DC4 TaxID=3055069 RepID=UPI0025B1F1EE|nr:chaperone modulator CbpM [Actinomadura sp. DC4]MDN3351988.1 chaperone modulator CbpM [Actinomadura sp. DC4]